MKLSFGNLMFETGDVLHIEDEFWKETYRVKNGYDCSLCNFYEICDKRNPNNTFAKFCKETHFEIDKK